LVMAQGWGARIGSNPTSWLYDPASTSARIVNRDLERAEAIEGDEFISRVRRALHGTRDEILESSLGIQRDVADIVEKRVTAGDETLEQLARTNMRITVLLAESGQLEEAFLHAAAIADPEIENALLAIYDTDSDAIQPGVEPLEHLAQVGLEGWLLERAAVRLLERRGHHDDALAIAHQLEERGTRWQRHADILTLANMGLIAAGAVLVIAMLCGRVRSGTTAPLVVPWSAGLGFAVLVRADFWNRLYFVVLASAGEALEDPSWLAPFYTWGTLLASLPMLWLVLRHLIPTGDLSPFGLRGASLRFATIVPIAAAALAIDLLGTTVLAWGTWGLGFEGHWAEGLDETLIWGNTREVIETCIDYVVWTPLFEELMFRGLVFFTLRNWLGRLPAALASAVFFSAIHFYSFPGFLMTFWSGFVWAIAFERARSLVPGIAAHAAYNLFFVLGIVLVYR
ncbi:MAG: CPBP family intramembrane metalloprotease, partial [bacterium]|nr:CPBP family intramembrane metalloprotease [bacterium]